jgi:hypothetical protein
VSVGARVNGEGRGVARTRANSWRNVERDARSGYEGFSELVAKKRKEREGEHERRKSMWSSGGGEVNFSNPDRMPAMPDWMADLASRADPDERMIRSSRAEPTEHAVMIAQRVWFLAMKKLGLRQTSSPRGRCEPGLLLLHDRPHRVT